MTIEVQPAKIVGAEIGDRVSWSTGRYPGAARTYGTIVGISTTYANHIEVAPEGREDDRRHIEPERLTLAPREYVVGDRVSVAADGDALPNGTVLIDNEGTWIPVFKQGGKWFVIDPYAAPGEPRSAAPSADRSRNIGWMPSNR